MVFRRIVVILIYHFTIVALMEFKDQCCKMTFNQRTAKHETEGVILASKYNGGNITCFACNESLSFVHEHTRNGNPVVAHFRHQPNSECKGESVEHKSAKALISKRGNDLKFIAICQCGKRHLHINKWQYEEELTWKQYRLDIGVKDGNNIIGAIEILHTHSIPDEKIQAFNEHDLIWYEVKARDVIEACETENNKVPIVRMKNSLCPQCRYIDPVVKERVTLFSQITNMTEYISPFHNYMLKMRKASEDIIKELNTNEEMIHSHLASISNQFERLHTGKFKGMSIVTVYVIQPDYVRWIAREGEGKGFSQEQLETANRLMKGQCLDCGKLAGKNHYCH
jgi:hypothetical protein